MPKVQEKLFVTLNKPPLMPAQPGQACSGTCAPSSGPTRTEGGIPRINLSLRWLVFTHPDLAGFACALTACAKVAGRAAGGRGQDLDWHGHL